MMGKTHKWGTLPKCGVGLSYCLVLANVSFKWFFATWWKKGVAKDTKMSPSHHIIRKNNNYIYIYLKKLNKKWLTHLDVEVMEVAWTKGGILKKFYNLCLTSNRIWLINGVHACQSTYLTKLKKNKNPWPFFNLWAVSMYYSRPFIGVFTSKFHYFTFFPTPPIKLNLGQQQIRGGDYQ